MEANVQNKKENQNTQALNATMSGDKGLQKKPRLSILKRIVKWGVLVVFCLVALWALVTVIWNWSADRRLDKKLTQLRARGEPLTVSDLQRHHEKLLADIERNGAYLYLAALKSLKKGYCKEEQLLPIINGQLPTLGERLSAGEAQKALDFLEKHTWFFELVELAQQCDDCVFPRQYTDGPAMSLPELGLLRKASRIILLKCYWATSRGDFDTAISSLGTVFRMARDIGNDWLLITQLVRVAIIREGISLLEHLLSAGALSADQLARLEKSVPETLDMDSYIMSLIAERGAAGLWCFDKMLAESATIFSMLNGGEIEKFLNYIWWLVPRGVVKDQCVRYLDFMTAMIDYAKLPPHEGRVRIRDHYNAFEKELKGGGMFAYVQNFLLELLVPLLDTSYIQYLVGSQRLILAHTVLALERFRLERGTLPETLDELVPEYIDRVPDDCFSSGKIRYLKDAKGYTVWSVSADGVDNGGKKPSLGYRESDDGFDIVVRIEK